MRMKWVGDLCVPTKMFERRVVDEWGGPFSRHTFLAPI